MTINAGPEPTQTGEQGSAGFPVCQNPGRRALPGLLGHRLPGDPHHTQGSPGNEAAGHPEYPLNLEGIVDVCRSRATVHYKVPLVNTGGKVILVTAYRIEHIMSPLGVATWHR